MITITVINPSPSLVSAFARYRCAGLAPVDDAMLSDALPGDYPRIRAAEVIPMATQPFGGAREVVRVEDSDFEVGYVPDLDWENNTYEIHAIHDIEYARWESASGRSAATYWRTARVRFDSGSEYPIGSMLRVEAHPASIYVASILACLVRADQPHTVRIEGDFEALAEIAGASGDDAPKWRQWAWLGACVSPGAIIWEEGDALLLGGDTGAITMQDAADMLNVSRPTLVKMLEDGKIPYQQVGTHRRLRLADVVAYREERSRDRMEALRELIREEEELGLPNY